MKRIIPLALALVAAFSAPAHAGSGLESPDSRGRVVTTCSKTADGGTVCQDKQQSYAPLWGDWSIINSVAVTTVADGGLLCQDETPPDCEDWLFCTGDIRLREQVTAILGQPAATDLAAPETATNGVIYFSGWTIRPVHWASPQDAGFEAGADAGACSSLRSITGNPACTVKRHCRLAVGQ